MRHLVLALVIFIGFAPMALADPYVFVKIIDGEDPYHTDARHAVILTLPATPTGPLPIVTTSDGFTYYDNLVLTSVPAIEEHFDVNGLLLSSFPTVATVEFGADYDPLFLVQTPDFGFDGDGGDVYSVSDTGVPTFELTQEPGAGVFNSGAPLGWVMVTPDPDPPISAPVPEPGTWLLMSTGLVSGVGMLRRRFRGRATLSSE